MFYSLAVAVCLAVFFILLAGSAFLCVLALWAGRRWLPFVSPRIRASFFFTLRAAPFLFSGLITLWLVLPSFLCYEPRSSGEVMAPRLLALAALGALVIAAAALRGWRIVRATHRAQKEWGTHSRALRIAGVGVPVYCSEISPLLAVTGLFRPQIFVSTKVVDRLSPGELFAAIAHELAHVSALDNFKQLILKITGAPRWLRLGSTSDAMWLNASEMAADEGALASGASALDLSSALVKVAALSRSLPAVDMIAASHFLPAAAPSCITARVSHLRKLLENEEHPVRTRAKNRKYLAGFSLLICVVVYAACVNALLPWIHGVLEMLVR